MSTQVTKESDGAIMKNLSYLKQRVVKELTDEHKTNLKKLKTVKKYEIRASYFNSLTKTRQEQFEELTVVKLRDILIKKEIKYYNKQVAEKIKKIEWVENAPNFEDAGLGVEWKKSYMWGNNPTADLKVRDSKQFNRFYSGSIGGCGYDKESTAIATVLNQSNAILKPLYYLAQEALKKGVNYRDYIGYGSGYSLIPYFEGGVGTSCYYSIFDKMGLKFEKIASGKTFDAWTITKK